MFYIGNYSVLPCKRGFVGEGDEPLSQPAADSSPERGAEGVTVLLGSPPRGAVSEAD